MRGEGGGGEREGGGGEREGDGGGGRETGCREDEGVRGEDERENC